MFDYSQRKTTDEFRDGWDGIKWSDRPKGFRADCECAMCRDEGVERVEHYKDCTVVKRRRGVR